MTSIWEFLTRVFVRIWLCAFVTRICAFLTRFCAFVCMRVCVFVCLCGCVVVCVYKGGRETGKQVGANWLRMTSVFV